MKIHLNTLYFRLIFVTAALILFQNCAQPPMAGCIKPGMEQMKIRWGITVPSTGQIEGYELDSRARLFSIQKKDSNSKEDISNLGLARAEDLCKSYHLIRAEIMKIQALNAPGDTSRFIELSSPGTNMNFYAVWNTKFTTKANMGFAAAYDTLMTMVRK